MKLYTLRGNLAGQPVIIKKMFKSREEAVDYMFEYSKKQYVFDLQIEEIENVDGDKHNIDYICNHDNRFNVKRIILA